MDLAGNSLRKVKVNLLSLEWGGGESIPIPSPNVFGFVRDLVVDDMGGGEYLEVDFGAYLGIQKVLVEDCTT
jgi:hypothetical protein